MPLPLLIPLASGPFESTGGGDGLCARPKSSARPPLANRKMGSVSALRPFDDDDDDEDWWKENCDRAPSPPPMTGGEITIVEPVGLGLLRPPPKLAVGEPKTCNCSCDAEADGDCWFC